MLCFLATKSDDAYDRIDTYMKVDASFCIIGLRMVMYVESNQLVIRFDGDMKYMKRLRK